MIFKPFKIPKNVKNLKVFTEVRNEGKQSTCLPKYT